MYRPKSERAFNFNLALGEGFYGFFFIFPYTYLGKYL